MRCLSHFLEQADTVFQLLPYVPFFRVAFRKYSGYLYFLDQLPKQEDIVFGSSLFPMDKMIFQFIPHLFL